MQFCVLVLFIAIGYPAVIRGYEVANQQQPIPSFQEVPKYYPDLSQQLKYAANMDGLLEFFDTPGLTCTVVAPTNQAISKTIKALGSSVGLFLQNKTMQSEVFNYHIIPSSRLTAQDLEKQQVTPALTKQGQTLWFVRRGDQLYAAFRRDYLLPLKTVDIKVKGCTVHTIDDMLLIPPSLMPTFEQWLKDAGSPPMTVPREEWAPPLTPAPGAADESPAAVQSEMALASQQGSTTAAPPSQSSGAGGTGVLAARLFALVLAAAAAATCLI